MKSKKEKQEEAQIRAAKYDFARSKAKRTGSATESEWNKARSTK
jgi:hypothetical protein